MIAAFGAGVAQADKQFVRSYHGHALNHSSGRRRTATCYVMLELFSARGCRWQLQMGLARQVHKCSVLKCG